MTTTIERPDNATAPAVDYPTFDADNHYYEATDAYTRHSDPKMAKRAMQWAEIDGRKRLLVGGKVNRFIPNPLFDPVAKPGSLDEYFRGRNPGSKDMRALFGDLEPIRPEYRDRDARLKVMDAQGIAGCFLFPTLGVGMEESLADDPEALVCAFEAFNRWLEDDWGYAYQERIFAAPMITLVDVQAAVSELERVLGHDARVICIKGGPAHSNGGLVSPADTRFDRFWGLVNESGVTVGIHSGDAGYGKYVNDWEPTGAFEAFRHSPLRSLIMMDRAPFETMAALVCQGLFDRFPKIRVATIESGADWVPILLKKLEKVHGQTPTGFASDPVEAFRSHVWVAPFYEDDMAKLKQVMDVDHLLFGSDWPHAEGLAEPREFARDLRRFDYTEDEIHTVMAENGWVLTKRNA
ncbi:MAG: amidohydrolase family protein [Acidimicrobiales bacterium]